MALALDANGASRVFIVGRREDRLKAVASEAIKGSVIPIVGDISLKESLQSVYAQVAAKTDHVDLFIANSGTLGPASAPPQGETTLQQLQQYLCGIPMEDFSRVLEVNVTGTFYSIITFLPLLDASNSRRPPPTVGVLSPPRPQIVVVSSIGGFLRAALTGYAYCASKAALNLLIKMLSTTLAKHHIRVNGIAPGVYYSELTAGIYARQDIAGCGVSDGSYPQDQIPLGRSGASEDIAGIILWMASMAGGYLSGSIIVSDGGRLSISPSSY
ncbi:hypothetical protein NQ176_g6412 [Zarea fungicola]|uniref:Uncharacterized protein n=1 Tax=Zarea fungicola TaxID=93591 RepID=A0ACC1N464_9HYPO|nr:hypothetical protein NQ176_g6412 [Lecanicillium fungicola]